MYNECRHIMPSGSKCHSPALTGKPYCYYHANLHRRSGAAGRTTTKLPVPQIEDARGIQLTLQQVLAAVESPFIHPRAIGHTLYGLQLAIQLLDRAKAPEPANVVRTLCNLESEPIHQPGQADQNQEEQNDQMLPKNELHQLIQTDPSDPGPEVLAPVKTVCEPPHDCLNCIHHETCDNYEEPDDDPTFEAEEEDKEDNEEEDEDDDPYDENLEEEDPEEDDEEDDDPDEEDLEEEEDEGDEEDDEGDEEDDYPEDAEEQQLITAALRILQKESKPQNRKTSHRRPPPDPIAVAL